MVELASPVNLTAEAHIKPVCLPGQDGSQYGGQQAVVTGWGTVGSGASLNSALHQVTLTVFNDSGKATFHPLEFYKGPKKPIKRS